MATEPSLQKFNDADLVYVDPETRTVVGRVEWDTKEQPVSKAYPKTIMRKGKQGEEEVKSWRKAYPWGTYRSMKRLYKIEGKIKDPEPQKTLEEVLPRALSEAYWEW